MGGSLTLQSIDARAVLLPLRRPIISKVGRFGDWPMILLDVYTREGIVGRSYLEPYLKDALGSIIPLIQTLGAAHVGKPIAPLDAFQSNRKSQNLIGYEGVTMIAVSGLDMAIWDALAKAAGLPLARMLGGTVGSVPAYNSNGLWLTDVSTLTKEAAELAAEGDFAALKLRLGRDALADDLAAIRRFEGVPALPLNSWSTSTRGFHSAMRCCVVMHSTTKACIGWRNRSPTTTLRVTPN